MSALGLGDEWWRGSSVFDRARGPCYPPHCVSYGDFFRVRAVRRQLLRRSDRPPSQSLECASCTLQVNEGLAQEERLPRVVEMTVEAAAHYGAAEIPTLQSAQASGYAQQPSHCQVPYRFERTV
jgi:hypothetical protein